LVACHSEGAVAPPADDLADDIGGRREGLCQNPSATPPPVDKIDLLFMVDNSNSMAEEQAALREQFPRLMQALTSGRRSPDDPRPFPPVRDLHVGVVSSDMGIAGVNFGTGTNCLADGGDDGILQSIGRGAGCEAQYPGFLSFTAGADAEQLVKDFACISMLGTGGCGFEQQLEAPLKALWPSVYADANNTIVDPNPIRFLANTPGGQLGHGDIPVQQGGNGGFLRNDPSSPSLIAIVVVTDEEDCSFSSPEFVLPASQLSMDSPYYKQDINLRCFFNPKLLYDVRQRYWRGFRGLRPGNEQRVVFAAIAGVPTDLVDAQARAAVDLSDVEAVSAFYERILDDPRMQAQIDPTSNPGTGTGNLVPSCTRVDTKGNTANAFPPRRIVELARAFGSNGMVQSICQDDFTPAIDAVVDMMAHRISQPCGDP
jgi:hypothetical protein